MNFNELIFPIGIAIIACAIFFLFYTGITLDHEYKMRKLDLIEKGHLKTCVELVDVEE